MKRVGKPVLPIILILITAFTFLSFHGISSWYGDTETIYFKGADDIRWGIDVQGGVEAVFKPDAEELDSINDDQMDAAATIINMRLVGQNITDSEVYTDYEAKEIIVRFPWQSGTTDFDPVAAIDEIGKTAVLEFHEGSTKEGPLVISGADVVSAEAALQSPGAGMPPEYVVQLKLSSAGKEKFGQATSRLAGTSTISIWLDDTMISDASVEAPILDGNPVISGDFTPEQAETLANQISSGALPFNISVDESQLRIISPTLGASALDSMVLAGIISFLLISIIMIFMYRLPGVISVFSLTGQVAGMLALITGFFATIPSFTLTIPGLAGMVLAIGMGVDANVITFARVREELQSGKSLDGSINTGYKNAFAAIFDGNITIVIISIILMGVFGPPDSMFAQLLSPLLFFFDTSITGMVYSFGFTLLTGVIFNFLFGVTATRLMLKSALSYKVFRKPWLLGGGVKK